MGSSIDLTGQYFGRWRVIKKDSEETKKHNHGIYWLCECSCSNHTQKSIRSDILRSNQSKSCGCLNNELRSQRFIDMNNNKRKDISGNKYGFLTVLKLSNKKNSQGQYLWECQCDCGNIHYVTSSNLHNYNVQSCGCINSITAAKIKNILQENNIDFKTEFTFPDLVSPDNNKIRLRFDFAIFKNNELSHLIEYDGETHYRYSSGWNTKEKYESLIRNDELKNQYCKNNNIKLIRISYLEKNNITIDRLLGEEGD